MNSGYVAPLILYGLLLLLLNMSNSNLPFLKTIYSSAMLIEVKPLPRMMTCSGIQLRISGILFPLTRDHFLDAFRLLLTLRTIEAPWGSRLQVDNVHVMFTFVLHPIMPFHVVGLACQ